MTPSPSSDTTPPGQDLAETLNRGCHCIQVDPDRLASALHDHGAGELLLAELLTHRPHLLSPSPVFVSLTDVRRMAEVVAAVERVVASPEYRRRVLAAAPPIAGHDPGAAGVFLGYDFHLTTHGPKLIEINTNAGGALLNLYLARAQRGCCEPVEKLAFAALDLDRAEHELVEMFRREWRREREGSAPRSLIILDEDPSSQFLYPEMVLFERLFMHHGLAARVADPGQLVRRDGGLHLAELEVDMIYNRLTDFSLEEPDHAELAASWLAGEVVLTPHPRTHALYANKHNLQLLADSDLLRSWGMDEATISTLRASIPPSERVRSEHADELWARRRGLFFKPAAGYGSRGAYRGDKLTRRVWQTILDGDYVAQERIPPSERVVIHDGEHRALKVDVRCFVYEGEVQLLGARLYQGQTTNLRTAGGGLATVFTGEG